MNTEINKIFVHEYRNNYRDLYMDTETKQIFVHGHRNQ